MLVPWLGGPGDCPQNLRCVVLGMRDIQILVTRVALFTWLQTTSSRSNSRVDRREAATRQEASRTSLVNTCDGDNKRCVVARATIRLVESQHAIRRAF